MNVNHSARSGGIIGDIFLIFYNMKVFCVFSLESAHRGDSYEYTQYTIFNIYKGNYPKFYLNCSRVFFKGIQDRV